MLFLLQINSRRSASLTEICFRYRREIYVRFTIAPLVVKVNIHSEFQLISRQSFNYMGSTPLYMMRGAELLLHSIYRQWQCLGDILLGVNMRWGFSSRWVRWEGKGVTQDWRIQRGINYSRIPVNEWRDLDSAVVASHVPPVKRRLFFGKKKKKLKIFYHQR